MTERSYTTTAGEVEDPEAYLARIKVQERLSKMMERPLVLTTYLLGINIVLWAIAKFYGMWLVDAGVTISGTNAEQLVFLTGMKINAAIDGGQWWRLLSSQYVHLNVMHLAFNGYGIWVLGQFLERALGPRRMMVLYTMAGTVGALASYLFSEVPSGGASGALYGLVGATMVFGFKHRRTLPEGMSRALTMGLLPWVVFGIGIGFIGSIPMDNAAHIGGLVAGAMLGLVFDSEYRPGEGGVRKVVMWVGLGMVAIALAATAIFWGAEAMQCLSGPEDFFECHGYLLSAR